MGEINFIGRNYPVPAVSAWNIVDPSKLNEFQACERKFFYRYVLGWTSEAPNLHFVFGTAWHLAMEHLRLNGFSPESVKEAGDKLEDYYRQYYSETTDLDMAPKNPGNARLALEEYADRYRDIDSERKTLYTEVLATVPVSENGRLMYGRLDAIVEDPNYGIMGIDFKTGSRRSKMWEGQWKTSLQMNFYYHVLNLAFPGKRIYGMLVDGVFFYKRKQKDEQTINVPVRVPVRKTNDMHQAWLSDTNYLIDMMEWNFEGLSKTTPDHNVMSCFPRRTSNCTAYNHLCPYHSFCTSWANPLKHCTEPPLGFKVEHWDTTHDDKRPKPRTTFGKEQGFEQAKS